MYDASIRRLLEMYPAGASCDQLLYHIRTSGTRATALDILQSLNALSGNGEVGIIAEGRWLLSRFLGGRASDNGLGTRELNRPSEYDVLRAVRGHAVSQPSARRHVTTRPPLGTAPASIAGRWIATGGRCSTITPPPNGPIRVAR